MLITAVLMGLAGTPHCLVMCGAACTTAVGRGGAGSLLAWHGGRLLAYAAAGAVAAASVGALATLGRAVLVLRPLWTLLHIAALVLGLYLLWQGRQPAWMASLGRPQAQPDRALASPGWQVIRGPVRSAGIGLAWVAWPCGLLQSALLVAALANSPGQGAGVMAGFAVASGLGLVLGPAWWWRWTRKQPAAANATSHATVRLAGAVLALASAWALGHGLWWQVAAWCWPPAAGV